MATRRASRRTHAVPHYHVELADRHAHRFQVTLTLPEPAAAQRLSLPVWIPGSYLVREFARHLSGLEARQDGRPCPLRALDKCSWQVDCAGAAGGPLQLRWQVYAFDRSVRTAWLDAQRGFFNGSSLLLRCEGFADGEHRLTLGALPAGWEVATGLPGSHRAGWTAPDYEALIDHPFELGPFWRGRFEAGGVPHEFVVAGAPPGFDGERLLADTRRICEAQLHFWHGSERPGFDRYVFMLAATDDGYGGLEHRNSTALICGRRDLPRRAAAEAAAAPPSDGYVTLLGLISHEYFHTWNVKRLRPAEFARYDLSRENPTELLWFFEGFTSYYDDLFLRRCGLIDEARYLELLARTLNQVLGSPGRLRHPVAAASFDAWIKYYRPDENSANATVSYYTKGALVALALDLTLRLGGRGTLDEVMQRLWTQACARGEAAGAAPGQGGPIDEAHIAAALREVGRRDFAAELAAWVHGTEELPLQGLLEAMGLRWSRKPPTLAQRLGARSKDGPGGPVLEAVMNGGVAEAAGLAAGDELLALDGWRLAKIDDLLLYGAFDPAGSRALPLLVSRDRRVLTLALPPGPGAAEGAVALAAQPKAGAAERRRREAWLGDAPR
ncbi:MAG: peptidase M61 [Burkholderiaceae bacterium]|nr:peptidase M61 [Burkholderiaceae bacterium]